MLKVIIFDYDGVIVDSFPAVHKVYRNISEKLGKRCPKRFSEFKKAYGTNSRELMKRLNFTSDEKAKADAIYREEILKQKPKIFPKIGEVIKDLSKKYKLVLVSSSPHEEVSSKLKSLGVSDFFALTVGGKELGPMKKSEALIKLIKDLSINKEDAVMIGDRIHDYRDAKEAGIDKIILVEYGWGYDKNQIPEHKQKVTVNTPSDLIKAIDAFCY